MQRDFPEYDWSLRTLDTPLRYFNIYRQECLSRGSRLFSRKYQSQAVSQDFVLCMLKYDSIFSYMYQGLQSTLPWTMLTQMIWNMDLSRKKSKKEKESFTYEGTNCVFSFDGHDKFMGFQNRTFSIAIHTAVQIQLVENLFGFKCGVAVAHPNLQLIGTLIICMNQNFCHIMLDLTREQRQKYQRLCMPIYGDNSVMLIMMLKYVTP